MYDFHHTLNFIFPSRHFFRILDMMTVTPEDIKASIDNLALKLEMVVSYHLKIIYWLLIVVSMTLMGVKGVEAFKSLGVN